MRHFLTSLLTGMTTVFAWTPANILLLLAWYGVVTGILFIKDVGYVRLCYLSLLGVSATIGYLALTSLCWGLKIKPKLRLWCLVAGAAGLLSVIMIGHMSNNALLQISFNVEQIYLFVCPLIFMLLHIGMEIKHLYLSPD